MSFKKGHTPEQLQALVKQAQSLAKEKQLGIPTTDPDVIKLSQSVTNLATKLGIDPEKVVFAIGRNFKTPVHFRAYAMPDPNKPKQTRKKKNA